MSFPSHRRIIHAFIFSAYNCWFLLRLYKYIYQYFSPDYNTIKASLLIIKLHLVVGILTCQIEKHVELKVAMLNTSFMQIIWLQSTGLKLSKFYSSHTSFKDEGRYLFIFHIVVQRLFWLSVHRYNVHLF